VARTSDSSSARSGDFIGYEGVGETRGDYRNAWRPERARRGVIR
jgi:hypothetical protein